MADQSDRSPGKETGGRACKIALSASNKETREAKPVYVMMLSRGEVHSAKLCPQFTAARPDARKVCTFTASVLLDAAALPRISEPSESMHTVSSAALRDAHHLFINSLPMS